MKKLYSTLFLSAILFSACTKHNENNEVNDTDLAFMNQISVSYKNEIAAGELALAKSGNTSIRAFGQSIVDGYKAADLELQKMADLLHVDLDNSIHQLSITRLNGLSGISLDTAYMNGSVNSHANMMKVYQTVFNHGSNAIVKGYVHRYVDKVKMQYLKADSLSRSLY